jgi:hypothetical protein
VRRPRIGAALAEVPPARMAQLKASCPDFPASVPAGLVVTGVAPGGPAAVAGLREEDVIVAWAPARGGGGSSSSSGGGGCGGCGAGRQQQKQQGQEQQQEQQEQQQQQQQQREQQRKQGSGAGAGSGAQAVPATEPAGAPPPADLIASFAVGLKRALGGRPLGLRVVRAAAGGGYETLDLAIAPEEAPAEA